MPTCKLDDRYVKSLIKRDTPMKVTDIHVDEYYCPACGAENMCGDEKTVTHTFCPHCGQRIFQKKEV